MNSSPERAAHRVLFVATVCCSLAACHVTTEPPSNGMGVTSREPVNARPVSGPSVNSATPSFGREGEVSKEVTIVGSGFAPDAQAAWERNGVADPRIQVSTSYVSSTELVATITIASDADIGLYDISVTNPTDRKKGIGYALFEVTTATQLTGTEFAYSVNSSGEIAGRVGVPGAFYYSPLSGLLALGSPGRAYAISEDGLTVGGGITNNAPNSAAYVWTSNAGVWQQTILPKNSASCIAYVRALGSDESGAAVLAGGVENDGCYKQNNLNRKPRIWIKSGASWIKYILPGVAKSDDLLDALTGTGLAVGRAGDRAAVWTPDGSGGWTLSQVGSSGSALHGIRADGTLAVGETGTVAQYWSFTNGTWTGPFNLPGGCTSAIGVDDAGNILANGCTNGNRRTPAVIAPPYTSASVRLLSGFGSSNSITAESISRSGEWIVGEGVVQGIQVGVYWRNF